MASESKLNGHWKLASGVLAFAVQLVAIVWGLSAMNSKISHNTETMQRLQPVVESVNIRMIRVETELSTINRDLEDCREHISDERRDSIQNGS